MEKIRNWKKQKEMKKKKTKQGRQLDIYHTLMALAMRAAVPSKLVTKFTKNNAENQINSIQIKTILTNC